MKLIDARKLLELLFPSDLYCISCESIIDKSRVYSLCDKCVRMFHWVDERTCEKCGKILQAEYLHRICVDCRENERRFIKGYTCLQYGLYERELLLAFKYGGKAYIGEKIARAMADRIKPEGFETDIIVPVPMHKRKLASRGYNQAEIIAVNLARILNLKSQNKLLLRTGYTAAMSRLAPEERRMNIENAFKVAGNAAKKIEGKRVLLVDDIYTTGSTADECSRALLEAGAIEVRFISFAAGANLIKWDKAAAQVCG